VGTGFPGDCATSKEAGANGKVGTGFPGDCATNKESGAIVFLLHSILP